MTEAEPTRPSLRVTPYSDMVIRTDARYAIKGLLPLPAFVLVFGASGSGKTFLVGNAALCVASGRQFLDHKVRKGLVVYIASENPTSVEQRFAAWRDELDIQEADLFMVGGNLDLLNPSNRSKVLNLLRKIAGKYGPISVVVIDTAAQSMPGADENTSEGMGGFVSACHAIRDELECCVVAVHHSGKDAAKGARGHSLLRAAVDVEIEVSESDGARYAKVTKSRDGATGNEIGFSLRSIAVGVDEDGDPITSCLVEPSAAMPAKHRKGPTGSHQKIVYQALQRVCGADGQVPPGMSPFSRIRAVTIDQLRDAAAADMQHIAAKHRSSRFGEAVTALKANKFADWKDEWIWIPTWSTPESPIPKGKSGFRASGGTPETTDSGAFGCFGDLNSDQFEDQPI